MKARHKVSKRQSLGGAIQNWEQHLSETMPPVPLRPWKERGYDLARFAAIGLVLGGVAGCTSLIFNVVGSVLRPAITDEPQHPLRIIQVYLTFPLGESALQLSSGPALALGCLLYLGTGMLYGMIFELTIAYLLPHAGLGGRLITCGLLAVIIWALNFYAVLLWLQPLLFGGTWIVDLIPRWVALLSHLVFGFTMAVLYPLGESHPRGDRKL